VSNSSSTLPQGLTDALRVNESRTAIEQQLQLHQQHLKELPADASPTDRAKVMLDIAEAYLALERNEQAWAIARETFDVFLQGAHWQEAVEACNILYQSEQPDSIVALGQGVWLAVTYPIKADTSVAMLSHIVDETPDDSDGAAVAAAVAHYIADLRTVGDKHESLVFLTTNLLGQVARRHSDVDSQEAMDLWIERLQLNDPAEFLPRLAKVIDVIVGDKWWFDRDELRAALPVN
jgi:hypothetical protein